MSERLSEELRLTWWPDVQDWGIINADGDRLHEFVGVYGRDDLSETERFEVVELVLASANDALEADPAADVDLIHPLLNQMREDAAVIVEYWEQLDDAEVFPLGAWLRARFEWVDLDAVLARLNALAGEDVSVIVLGEDGDGEGHGVVAELTGVLRLAGRESGWGRSDPWAFGFEGRQDAFWIHSDAFVRARVSGRFLYIETTFGSIEIGPPIRREDWF